MCSMEYIVDMDATLLGRVSALGEGHTDKGPKKRCHFQLLRFC